MNRRELFKQLNSLCKELDYRYNINSGGCCFIAAVISEQLEIYNIPHTIIYYNFYGCHYAIRVKDRIINRCDYKIKEIVSDKFISSVDLYFTYNNEYWNKTYNKKHNPIIKRKVKSLFKKYENRGKRFCNGRCSSRQ